MRASTVQPTNPEHTVPITTTTLGEMQTTEQTIDYWKERLTESGATNTRLRTELDTARFQLRDTEREVRALREQLALITTFGKALAKVAERVAERLADE